MQLVPNGPDIPERLLHAHEQGRVVFFCGAGISKPAGLPLFGELVELLSKQVGEPLDHEERSLCDRGEYDRAIGHFERRIVGGSQTVRQGLHRVLTPDLTRRHSLTSHRALLILSQHPASGFRIVTTNFDTLFETAASKVDRMGLTVHPEPPVRANWRGLVHLHGRLPATQDASGLDRLTISDSDFGRAYLTDGWAARFVTTLFREAVVCFVGYRLDDPVLRYMTAAQAIGEPASTLFALAAHDGSNAGEERRRWEDKQVTPVLYDKAEGHRVLHRTLHVWAALYRDGKAGKERIIARYARRPPQSSSSRDDFIGRVLWAISDPSDLPARKFAEMTPTPPLEWLDVFTESRLGHDDLRRFGVAAKGRKDEQLRFSFLNRPAPYDLAPRMCLVSGDMDSSRPDAAMWPLAGWLLDHLDNPKLLLWVAGLGGQLHPSVAHLFRARLDALSKWERENNTAELDHLRLKSSDSIPRPLLRKLWILTISGRLCRSGDNTVIPFYDWFQRLESEGLTHSLRLRLRELLCPRIQLSEALVLESLQADDAAPWMRPVDWELVLNSNDLPSALAEHGESPAWKKALPSLLEDITQILHDAMNVMAELGDTSHDRDRSYLVHPSIIKHEQNLDLNGWPALIGLARDAWLAAANQQASRAKRAAEQWWEVGYPVFRRLALFAAAHGNIIPVDQAVAWLRTDDAWWLWNHQTKREVMLLLVALAQRAGPQEIKVLEEIILAGPPRHMYRDDLEAERWKSYSEEDIALRLEKLQEAGASLSDTAQQRLQEIRSRHPRRMMEPAEREEFPSGVGPADFSRRQAALPRRRRELVQWLREHPCDEEWPRDGWPDSCQKHFPATACALWTLACENVWLTARWSQALHAWSRDPHRRRSWRCMSAIVGQAPEQAFRKMVNAVAWWLSDVADQSQDREALLLQLCDRVLAIRHDPGEDSDDEPLNTAINHPVGRVGRALLQCWYQRKPSADDGIPIELSSRFSRLLDTMRLDLRHGRAVLAAEAVNLFLVDSTWTEQHLLPLFDWHKSEVEARGAWASFLIAGRFHRPLFEAIKSSLIEAAKHFVCFHGHGRRRFAQMLAHLALDPGGTYTTKELRAVFDALPEEALTEALKMVTQSLDACGDQHQNFWDHRVMPFWKNVWPRSSAIATPMIAEELFMLCIAAESRFPEALEAVRAWLRPPRHFRHALYRFHKTDLASDFPNQSLMWLDLLIEEGSEVWPVQDKLNACLDRIEQADPSLVEQHHFRRLRDMAR